MAEPLVVLLNADGPHSIDAPTSYETTEGFDVVLDNRGEALHVHLHLDDDLARGATVSTNNHYVQEGTVRRVRVDAWNGPRPVKGHLEVVTGYGSERAYVDVALVEPEEVRTGVKVDERLATPAPTVEREPPVDLDLSVLPVAAVAGIALLLALFTLTLLDGLVVAIGALVIVLGLATAALLLLR